MYGSGVTSGTLPLVVAECKDLRRITCPQAVHPLWTSAVVCGRVPPMAANLTPREDRRRRALETIMRTLDVKDASLAVTLGISRSAIQARRNGGVRLREDQCEEMAAGLGVPYELFDMEATDVLRWLADNRAEQVFAASGWSSQFPSLALTG